MFLPKTSATVLALVGLHNCLAGAAPTITTTTTTSVNPTTSTSNSDSFCSSNTEIVSCFKKNPSATPYCSSFISIKTQTITETKTVDPDKTSYLTISMTRPTTIYTSTSTKTLTQYTYSATFSSLYTGYTPVTSAFVPTSVPLSSCYSTGNVANNHITKRQASTTKASTTSNKYCYTSSYPPAGISAACSCLNLPTPTVTSTLTVSGAGKATTSTVRLYTTTVSKVKIATNTITAFSSGTLTSYYYPTSTVTYTSLANAGGVEAQLFEIYNNQNVLNQHYDSNQVRDRLPFMEGRLPSISTPDAYQTLYWPDTQENIDTANTTLLMHGFFIPLWEGQYTFATSVNDVARWQMVWIGDSAFQWIKGDEAYSASATTDNPDNWTGGSVTVHLSPGDILPMTVLWALGAYRGKSMVKVTIPSGDVYDVQNNFFVPPCPDTFAW